MGVNGGGIWVVRETSPVSSPESLNGSTSLLSHFSHLVLEFALKRKSSQEEFVNYRQKCQPRKT